MNTLKATTLIALFAAAALPLAAKPTATKPTPTSIALRDINGVSQYPLRLGANKATVLIFITDDCPISNSYAPTINRLYAEYAPKKIGFSLISVDTGVSAAAIKRHAKQYAFRCQDLIDPKHTLAKQLGATVTPEAFIYGANGKPLYKGRIDNKYADFGQVRFAATTHDLDAALAAVADGKPVSQPVTKAIGCYI